MQLEFGYLPEDINVRGPDWSISTLPGLDAVMSAVSGHADVRDRWTYPNHGGIIPKHPSLARIFSMPKTHVIEHRSGDTDRVKFLIWVLSFFKGIRLTSEVAGFLDATPVEKGMLVDFIPIGKIENAVELAEAFWTDNRHEPLQTKRLQAAIHTLFLAQNRHLLQFEKFIYLYATVDACSAILRAVSPPPNGTRHGELVKWICDELGLPCPVWATTLPTYLPKKKTEVSILRNDVLHEALFEGEPLGFALEAKSLDRNLPIEMRNLTCRILAHIMQVPDRSYIEMPTDIYARHNMNL